MKLSIKYFILFFMKKIQLNSKFIKLFDKAQLKDIVKHASLLSQDCIVIATNTYFFELSADRGNEIEIYCDEYSNITGRKLSKDNFMCMYKCSPQLAAVQEFYIDD